MGGAVVLLQADGPGVGEIVGEGLDILDFRTAPAVHRLVIVAHDEHAAPAAAEQAHPLVLDGVGVLEFVDQQVLEARPVTVQQFRVISPQFIGAQQQFTKIDQPAACAFLLIEGIDLPVLALHRVAVVAQMRRALALILAAADESGALRGRPLLVIQIQPAQDAFEQAILIVAVEDLKGAWQARFLPVHAQQTMGDAVKGADPQPVRRLIEHLRHPAAHLGGGLVGEGHRQDRPGRSLFLSQQPGDAPGQHPGLATAGAGQHPYRSQRCGDRLALGFIEISKNRGNVHGRAF